MSLRSIMPLLLLAAAGLPEPPPEERSGAGKWCPRPRYPSWLWRGWERLTDADRAQRVMAFALSEPRPHERWPSQARDAALALAAALEIADPYWMHDASARNRILTLVDELDYLGD